MIEREKMLTNVEIHGLRQAVIASGYPMIKGYDKETYDREATIGDYRRAKALGAYPSQEGHDNFLSGILVAFDLTCSIKMWTEFERYHFAQIVSSMSTMHRLSEMDLSACFDDHTDESIISRVKELQEKYRQTKNHEDYLTLLYSCPVGLKLTARVATNYRQLKTMYIQRHAHPLDEWQKFCEEILAFKEFRQLTGVSE